MQASDQNPFGLMIVVVLAAIAISGSDKKWRTLLYILGCAVLGFAIGTGIGFAFGNAAAAGTLAGLTILLMAGGASVKKMLDNRKTKKPF